MDGGQRREWPRLRRRTWREEEGGKGEGKGFKCEEGQGERVCKRKVSRSGSRLLRAQNPDRPAVKAVGVPELQLEMRPAT